MTTLSTSTTNTSFSNVLRSKTKALDSIDDYKAWDIFLRDHRHYLRMNCTPVRLPEIERIRSSYRLHTFLKDQPAACTDILPFLIVNNYSSIEDFNLNSVVVLVPSASSVNELRKQYNTYRSVLRRATHQTQPH